MTRLKEGKKTFTKIRKWAELSGAKIEESNAFDRIYIEWEGMKFVAEMRESSSRQTISRGRGLQWSGSPAGFYFGQKFGFRCYMFQSTQKDAIAEMEGAARKQQERKGDLN